MKASELIEAKLSKASPEWLRSKEGKRMVAKCLRHIKVTEGAAAARQLSDKVAIWMAI